MYGPFFFNGRYLEEEHLDLVDISGHGFCMESPRYRIDKLKAPGRLWVHNSLNKSAIMLDVLELGDHRFILGEAPKYCRFCGCSKKVESL